MNVVLNEQVSNESVSIVCTPEKSVLWSFVLDSGIPVNRSSDKRGLTVN